MLFKLTHLMKNRPSWAVILRQVIDDNRLLFGLREGPNNSANRISHITSPDARRRHCLDSQISRCMPSEHETCSDHSFSWTRELTGPYFKKQNTHPCLVVAYFAWP